jgi:ABC-type antimicrobial peptide transport system permease subunit
MDLVNEAVVEKRLDELKESGVVLSPEQIEHLKYEIIGRALTQKTRVLHAESGTVVMADLCNALLVASVAQATTRDFFIINPQVQPLYNIRNEYMGFSYYGKVRNLKKEKRRFKNIRTILSAITMVSMFIIGFKTSFFVIIVAIVAVLSFGGYNLMLGRGEA